MAQIDCGLQHFALRREPEAVIDQFRIARHQLIFEVRSATVERDRFDGAVGRQQDRAARRFVDAARLHADEAVFHEVETTDAVIAAIFIELGKKCRWRKTLAIDRNGIALFKADLDDRCLVGSGFRRNGAHMHIFRRFQCRIFQNLALGRGMQQVGVDGERRFALLILGNRDLVLFGEFEQMRAALERPVAPWSDDLDVRVQRISGKLEAHLIVALAGCAMRNGVGAGLLGNLDEMLGNQRTGNRRAEQINAFIDGIGAEHRENEIAHEFFAYVLNEDFLDAQHFRFLACRFKFFALAEIRGESHNFRAEFRLKPFQDDRGVETARIGEHDFLNVFPLAHSQLPIRWMPHCPLKRASAGLGNGMLLSFYQLLGDVQAGWLRLIEKTGESSSGEI